MKTNKSYKEAILRAQQSEQNNEQSQEYLLHLKEQMQHSGHSEHPEGTPIIETSKNLMRSWMNLRNLDCNMADKDNQDLSFGSGAEGR